MSDCSMCAAVGTIMRTPVYEIKAAVVGRYSREQGRGHRDCYVFFFQAEDGIRDYKVTGVQTCALPICALSAVRGRQSLQQGIACAQAGIGLLGLLILDQRGEHQPALVLGGPAHIPAVGRSEERRVGKECRSRWSPYH